MPADYHTHTPLCRHAEGEPEAYIDAAIAAGVTEYGISDHAPALPEPFDDWRMLESELPEYFSWLDRARRHANGRIPIRAGLECDWISGCGDWITDLAGRYSWDYLIGSVHYLGDWDFDNPKWLGRWAQSDVDAVWTHYWKTYADMAESGLFDILGHADLVKKFCHIPGGDLDRFYEPAIDAIAASGCAIELNTAGWHKPCAEATRLRAFWNSPALLASLWSFPLTPIIRARSPGISRKPLNGRRPQGSAKPSFSRAGNGAVNRSPDGHAVSNHRPRLGGNLPRVATPGS